MPTNSYLLLFSLYWAQGLPVGFMTHALPVILRAEGVSLTQIGGFGLLMSPWALKVLWAPWVDQRGYSKLGHYRTWILVMQLLSIILLVLLAFTPMSSSHHSGLLLFFCGLLLLNLVGATQDIATDGLAVKLLKQHQQHWGNTFQVIGSRLGFIVGGGAILWAIDWLEWKWSFLCLALLVTLNSIPILYFKENVSYQPSVVIHQKTYQFAKVKQYLRYFIETPERRRWLWVLISFKVADGLAGPVIKAIMVDLGLSLTQIGVYVTMLGAAGALVGAAIASYCLRWFNREKALLYFSVCKILSWAGFVWLAAQFHQQHIPSLYLIYTINLLEDFTSALLLVVILTLIMHYCRAVFAATDFTFQVSVMALVSGGLYIISGWVADYLGYLHYLELILLIAFINIFIIFYWMKLYQNRG